jgi:hypothetical protein
MAEDQTKSTTDQQPIRFQVPAGRLPAWYVFMRRGFRMAAPAGRTVREILCGQVGVPSDYLDNRVQTLFINGQPVDDVDRTVMAPGDELSLSAAMPGLAGASLRKGGHLAAFRDSISYRPQVSDSNAPECLITIKLFNFVAVELGPLFLNQGLLVPRRDLLEFLGDNRLSLVESGIKITRGHQPLTLGELTEYLSANGDWVDIQVSAA